MADLEMVKEVTLGGAVGLLAGYATKKLGAPVMAGVFSSAFLLYRGAVFDGYIQASWSPLKVDDATLPVFMRRKLRRQTMGPEKRLEKFLDQNFVILGSFAGGLLIGQVIS